MAKLIRDLAIGYVLFFSLSSLTLSYVTAIGDSNVSELNGTQISLRLCLIIGTWANAMLALITNAAKRVQKGEFPIPIADGDTQITQRTDTLVQQTTTTTPVPVAIDKPPAAP